MTVDPGPAERPPRWHTLLELPMLLGLVGVLGLLGMTASARLGYPYDLEWMEGGMLLHVLRVVNGEGLYVTPSSDFIPFIYPPLYHWVLAALSPLTGVDYLSGRVVSLVGILAGASALVAAIRQEGGSWLLGAGVAAAFLTTYDETGAFFDLVRIDGLLLALLGWSLVAVRGGWVRTGGLLLVLAFATKHNAAIFGLPALIWLWRTQGRATALRFAAWSVLPALAFTAGMLFEGDGLFLTYLLGVPAGHPFVFGRFLPGTPMELAKALPVPLVFAVVGGLVGWRARTDGTRYWLWQGGLAIVFSAVMRGHHGGFLNVLIPGMWALSLWGGLGVIALRRKSPHAFVVGLTSLVLWTQVWFGKWNPQRYHPTPQDIEAGQRVVAAIAEVDGEVLAPWQPWLAVQAGKEPALHLIGLWDIDHDWGPLVEHVEAIEGDMAAQRWGGVMVANDKLGFGLKEHYRRGPTIKPAGNLLMPKTGWRVRPARIYLPKARPVE